MRLQCARAHAHHDASKFDWNTIATVFQVLWQTIFDYRLAIFLFVFSFTKVVKLIF